MIKNRNKITYIALLLFAVLVHPLKATEAKRKKRNSLVQVFEFSDIGKIVVEYIGYKGKDYMNPLDLSIRLQYEEHAKKIIGKTGKDTTLLLSAELGYLACVKYLVGQEADIDAENIWEKTPLHVSASEGHLDCVKYLVKHGADIDAQDHNEETALLLSAYNGHFDCFTFLVEKGADIHAINMYGETALYYSTAYNHKAITDFLQQQIEAQKQ